MKKIEEEVPTSNISGGAIADPQNKMLGKAKKKAADKSLMLFRRWSSAAEGK